MDGKEGIVWNLHFKKLITSIRKKSCMKLLAHTTNSPFSALVARVNYVVSSTGCVWYWWYYTVSKGYMNNSPYFSVSCWRYNIPKFSIRLSEMVSTTLYCFSYFCPPYQSKRFFAGRYSMHFNHFLSHFEYDVKSYGFYDIGVVDIWSKIIYMDIHSFVLIAELQMLDPIGKLWEILFCYAQSGNFFFQKQLFWTSLAFYATTS